MLLRRGVVVVLAAGAIWFGYRWMVPSDGAQVARVLDRIAEALSAGAADEGEVARLARAASIRSLLDPEIKVDAGPPFTAMRGRDTIVGTAARLQGTLRQLEIQFEDVQITVSEDRSTAQAYLTAEARFENHGERGVEARELDVTFTRRDGDWVVSAVTLVRTLEPLGAR